VEFVEIRSYNGGWPFRWKPHIMNFDIQELKYEIRMGVVSPVVYTLTNVYLVIIINYDILNGIIIISKLNCR